MQSGENLLYELVDGELDIGVQLSAFDPEFRLRRGVLGVGNPLIEINDGCQSVGATLFVDSHCVGAKVRDGRVQLLAISTDRN
jgi:hypothetical protein